MRTRLTPNRDKRRNIFLLRGMLLVAVGALLIDSGTAVSRTWPLALVLAFAFSELVLLKVPLRWLGSLCFDTAVAALDIVLVSLGIYLAGASSDALPISCLLMVAVVALANYKPRVVAGAALVGALHAWLVLGPHAGLSVAKQLTLQMLFLCAVAIYYGYLAQAFHQRRRREEADLLPREELLGLLDILGSISSSLDLREVTRLIVTKLATVVPAVRCSIVLTEDEGRCRVLASHDDPEVDMLEIDLEKYPEIRLALDNRCPVIVEDVASDPVMEDVRSALKSLDVLSILVIPITFADELLGGLCIKTARAKEGFSPAEISFSTAVARASANALKNAMLHRKVEKSAASQREVAEKLERILEQSPDLIFTTDEHGLIEEFNSGAENLLGFCKSEVQGQPCRQLFPSDEHTRLVEEIRTPGSLSVRSVCLRRNDGAQIDVELSLAPLQDDAGRHVGTVWVGRDVTQLKSMQLQLIQADKLSAIGEVISGVAHELNNPLTGVLGYAQLLMARHGSSPMARDLGKISDAATRCQKIVQNLLSFARAHNAERKYLGVNGIIDKTLDLKKHHLQVNGIEVERELALELPRTMLDFHQMQQVFLNLINNAEMAMVTVPDRRRCLTIRTSHTNGSIRVEVTDTGPGIEPGVLARIFDPFFTTKRQGKGTGLGLSVSYGIVQAHGGQIHASGRPGKGATFIIDLPILAQPEDDVPTEQVVPLTRSGNEVSGARLLVVDDEPVVLDLLVEVLEDAGHRVDTAANGDEAFRKIRVGDYDVVVTDVKMPEMSGIEFYHGVTAARPEMRERIVVMTGDLVNKETKEFLAEVGVPTIAKPLDIRQVVRTVTEILQRVGSP